MKKKNHKIGKVSTIKPTKTEKNTSLVIFCPVFMAVKTQKFDTIEL